MEIGKVAGTNHNLWPSQSVNVRFVVALFSAQGLPNSELSNCTPLSTMFYPGFDR